MKEIKARWFGETPDFFKKAIKIGSILATVGGAVLLYPIALPGYVSVVATHFVAIGGVTALLAKLTVKDSDSLPAKETPE